MLQLPVMVAPMAGVSKARLVIASLQNGMLGSLGAGMMSPDAIRQSVGEIRAATSKPFNINLFVVNNNPEFDAACGAAEWLRDYSAKYNYDFAVPTTYAHSFDEQFAAALECKPAILSFTFNIISQSQLDACHDNGIKVIGTATSLDEALAWQKLGADAVCLQGIEAGGHRGNFLTSNLGIPLAELVDQVLPEINVPVIAAGGIMDGVDAARYLHKGVALVQLGTVFLAAPESELAEPWIDALKGNMGNTTTLTPSFSGKHARGIVNRFISESKDKPYFPYPVQNAYTASLRKQAGERKNSQDMSLWAGTEFPRARFVPISELAKLLKTEIELS